jgi:putative membrane protein
MARSVRSLRHLAWLALAGLAACHGASAPARPPAPRVGRVPDASTLAILLMSNNVDLAYGRVAASRSTSREIKAFAWRLTADYTSLNKELSNLATRLSLTPRDDDISRLLRDQSTVRRDSLRAFSGRRFDSAYVANEVRYHRELLIAIDQVFMPSVQRPALREYVATLRPTISAHLAEAEQLQTALLARK